MALKLFWDTRRKKEEVLAASTDRQGFFRILYGLVAGGISGTFGTSGTAPVMAGLFSLRLGMKVVIGTSLLVILVNTVFATSAHFLLGRVDLTLVTFLTAGSAWAQLWGPACWFIVSAQNTQSPYCAMVMPLLCWYWAY